MMASGVSRYACDGCRTSKIRCSRELTGCVIRRHRKRKDRSEDNTPRTLYSSGNNVGTRSQLEDDISTTEERLNSRPSQPPQAYGSLASLSAEYFSFWQDPGFLDMAERLKDNGKTFFTFEQEAEAWIELFSTTLEKGKPVFTQIPANVLSSLVLHPENVRDKAYLVMFYGMMLTAASSDRTYDKTTILKLKWNLWLSLNDARLLLEPTDLNIQALMLLALHVQDFHTPSLCWMLMSSACRMLQILGIDSKRIDRRERERRVQLFWTLNYADQLLALIFGRPSTFSAVMADETPIPSIQALLSYQPHVQTNKQSCEQSSIGRQLEPSLFGAHYLHFLYQLSKLMAEIWSCLYTKSNEQKLEGVKAKLDEWYHDANTVLSAALTAEKPLLNTAAQRELELGIRNVNFQYHHLTVLLTRKRNQWRDQCLHSSREALFLLDGMVSDSGDVYNGVVWQLLYCPFTPYFVLFGAILSRDSPASKQVSFEAMQCLPRFMEKMTSRHPQASKLYHISWSLTEEASTALGADQDVACAVRSKGSNKRARNKPGTSVSAQDTPSVESRVKPSRSVSDTSNVLPPNEQSKDKGPCPGFHDRIVHLGLPELLQKPNATAYSAQEEHLSEMFMFSDFDWFSWDSNTASMPPL